MDICIGRKNGKLLCLWGVYKLSVCPGPRPRSTEKLGAARRKRELATVSLRLMFTSCTLASPIT